GGGDGLERPPDLGRRVRLQVEQVDVRRPAVHEQEDDGPRPDGGATGDGRGDGGEGAGGDGDGADSEDVAAREEHVGGGRSGGAGGACRRRALGTGGIIVARRGITRHSSPGEVSPGRGTALASLGVTTAPVPWFFRAGAVVPQLPSAFMDASQYCPACGARVE